MAERVVELLVEERAHRLVLTADAAGEGEAAAVSLVDPAIEDGDGGLEAVAVIDEQHAGVGRLGGDLAVVPLGMGGNAHHGGFQQRPRPAPLAHGPPPLLARPVLHGANSRPAAAPAFRHALHSLDGVKAVTLEWPIADLHGLD